MKRNNWLVVAAIAVVVAIGVPISATAASLITGDDIKNGTVMSQDVKNGSLGLHDLGPKTIAELQGSDGKDGVVVPVYEASGPVNVAKVGGKFSENATMADQFTLSAGKYLVTTDALFRSNQATSGNTTLQVAVRAADGSEWGADLGTGFTGSSPEQQNREVTTSTTRVVTLVEDTMVTVSVFGYENNGTGSADSGKFDAEVYLTAVPVQ